MSNSHLDRLKGVFGQFADKNLGSEDIAGRIVRSLAAGGKAAVDHGMMEFPKSFVRDVSRRFYDLLASQEVADAASAGAMSVDKKKARKLVEAAALRLQNPETALIIARLIKKSLNAASMDKLEAQAGQLLKNRPLGEQFVFFAIVSQIRPMLEDMKSASDNDVAGRVVVLARAIPADAVASEIAAFTHRMTPENIAERSKDLVDKLPSPDAVADAVHDLGQSASKHLERIAQSRTPNKPPASKPAPAKRLKGNKKYLN